jgi:hypothetical protein
LRARVEAGERAMNHLGPTKVLERGYSITSLEGSSTPLRDAARVHGGQTLMTRLAHGEIRSLVRSSTTDPKLPRAELAPQPTLFDTIENHTDTSGDQGAEDD